jgi:hypothetical protein
MLYLNLQGGSKMKKLICITAGIALITIYAAPAFCLIFSIDPATQSIQTGDEAMFELNISQLGNGGPPSLGAFEVTVNYDPNLLAFLPSSLVFSNFLGAPDTDWRPFWTDTFESDIYVETIAGQVWLSETSWLTPIELQNKQPSDFTLVSFAFTGLGIGDDVSLIFDPVVLVDETLDANVLARLNLTVNVNIVEPIPEPATLILVASGLGGMALFRRKKLRTRR